MAVRLPKDQPFWTSVILHAVVLVALFLATVIQALKPKESEHVFEMVSMPEDLPVAELNTAPDVPPPPDLPDIEPMDIPEPTPPAPQPRPQAPQPTPKPQPAKPQPPKEKPVEEISVEEFWKQHGKPKPRQQSQSRPQPVQPSVNVERLDVGQVHVPQNLPKSQQPTRAELNALQQYIATLGAKLDRAWRRPQHLGGSRLSVTVFFDVSSTGVISNIRLRPSSGDSSFDQSVKDAFRRVTTPGPTPDRRRHTFEKTFRMLD